MTQSPFSKEEPFQNYVPKEQDICMRFWQGKDGIASNILIYKKCYDERNTLDTIERKVILIQRVRYVNEVGAVWSLWQESVN